MLSESVGKAIQLTGGNDAQETANFILLFHKFFDMLNVSNFTKKKPFQYPYHTGDDQIDSLIDSLIDRLIAPLIVPTLGSDLVHTELQQYYYNTTTILFMGTVLIAEWVSLKHRRKEC